MPPAEIVGQEHRDNSVALYAMAQLLADRKDLSSAFGPLAELIRDQVPLDFASLMVLDAEPDMERVVGWYPADAIDEAKDARPHRYPRTRGRDVVAGEYRQGVEWDPGKFPGRPARRMSNGGVVLAWSMPLMAGDAYYGMVTVARRERCSFTERETRFMRSVGQLLAAAAREEHAIWKAERETARSLLLNELTVLLNEGRPVEELFGAMVTLLSRAVSFEYAGLLRADGEGDLQFVVSDPVELGEVLNDANVNVSQEAVTEAGRWLQFDPKGRDGAISERLHEMGVRMVSVIFLAHMGTTIGALVLARGERRKFSDDELEFLALAGTLMAQAMVNKEVVDRQLREGREETAEHRAVAAVAALTAEKLDAGQLIDGLAKTLGDSIPKVRVAFALLDGQAMELYRSRTAAIEGDVAALGQLSQLAGQVTMQSAPPDLLGTADWFAGRETHAVSVAPDRSAGALRGVLVVGSGDPDWRFGTREERLVRTAAQFAGSALHTVHGMQRLERSRALLDLVVQSFSEGIVLLDAQGEPAFMNERGRAIVQAMGPYLDGTESRTAGAGLVAAAISKRGPAQGEAVLDLGDGQRLHRFVVAAGHDGYSELLVVEDIQEEREREIEREATQQRLEQTARLSALGELVGGVAHELNNPLTAIIGFAELMLADDASKRLRGDLGMVHKEALRARNIVRDLLFLVRPGEVEREEVRLQDVVGHIERLRRSEWLKRGISVRVLTEDGEGTVVANENQLAQVLLNLVTNAEQALGGSTDSRLSIRTYRDAEEAIIEVTDNGPGMDADVKERIWEPFFTTKPGVGTGLGLSLSRTIIQSHGGRLECDSAPGEGTVFRVRIPTGAGGGTLGDTVTPIASDPGKWIMVVDDEPSLRKVAGRLIESLGHQCGVAETVEDAVDLALERDYDLVLCDYRLASAVADDVIAAFLEFAPHLVPRVVIATGATTDPGIGRLASRYGLRVLPKPYGMDEISQLVQWVAEAA